MTGKPPPPPFKPFTVKKRLAQRLKRPAPGEAVPAPLAVHGTAEDLRHILGDELSADGARFEDRFQALLGAVLDIADKRALIEQSGDLTAKAELANVDKPTLWQTFNAIHALAASVKARASAKARVAQAERLTPDEMRYLLALDNLRKDEKRTVEEHAAIEATVKGPRGLLSEPGRAMLLGLYLSETHEPDDEENARGVGVHLPPR